MSNPEKIQARSNRGLEILKEAFNRGEMVLEFDRQEDGSITVVPIGDHVKELERKVDALQKENQALKNND